MHGVCIVSRTIYYYTYGVYWEIIICIWYKLYVIILASVKAIIIIISMYLTLVGSLNLTVAIIDHQFTRSFITGLTKVRIEAQNTVAWSYTIL